MARIATLLSEQGNAEVLFQDGIFTLGASEQVTPSQLLAWSDEGRLRWEHDGMAEWVSAYSSEAPLSSTKRGGSPLRTVLAAVLAIMVLLGSAGIGVAAGRSALEQRRAGRERLLAGARHDAEVAERKVMMLGEAVADLPGNDGGLIDPIPGPGPTPEPNPQPQPASFTEYCSIHTYYTGGGFSSETGWVHFKTVNAQGMTVKEQLGSDLRNMRKEGKYLAETSKRHQLVDKLRQMMTSAGWTEVGVREGGEWYEYVFGRGGGD